jgi:H+/Cl- antiporter ClcA
VTANRWQHLALAVGLALFAIEDIATGDYAYAAISFVFAAGCVAMALLPSINKDR